MNSSIALLSSQVFDHKFQRLTPNKYEQGNEYVVSKNKCNNRFINIPRYNASRSESRNGPVNGSRNVPVGNGSRNVPLQSNGSRNVNKFLIQKTLFEKISFVHERGRILDFSEYKNIFHNSLSDDVYRSVSKRHQCLKRDFYAFIHETEFVLPKNKEVLRLFSNVLNTNLMVCLNKKMYVNYSNPKWDNTIVASVDDSVLYKCELEATMELAEKGMCEHTEYKDMKITELKVYAEKLGVDIKSKKKAELLELIADIYKN